MSAVLASGFQTGAVLSLVLPLALLLAVAAWWFFVIRRGVRR